MMREGGDGGQAAGGRSVLRDLTVQIFMLQVAVMLCVAIGSAAGATVAVITPASAQEGSTFSITIQVQSVTDLYGAQFDLTFNPSVLEVLSVSEGPFLKQGAGTFWLAPTIDNVAGTIVDAAQVRLDVDDGVDGSGTLATISFRAKATGTSSLSLGGILLSDSNGLPISSTSQPGSVTVQPPPPPPEAPDTQIISGPIGTIYTTLKQKPKDKATT